MEPIDASRLRQALAPYAGREVYLHVEFARGGFARNVKGRVISVALRGDGPYRVGLRCEEAGWVVMEGLTHWLAAEGQPLFLCGLDEEEKLDRALQLHFEPLEA